MPELPEVEIVRQSLDKKVKQKRIKRITNNKISFSWLEAVYATIQKEGCNLRFKLPVP